MPDIDVLAVAVATVAAFVASAVYYGVLGERLAQASPAAAQAGGEMPPWKVAAELGRCLVLCAVFAGLAAEAGASSAGGGILLGLALWVGFPLVLWTGAMLHERTPLALAAIHGGDWLLKLVLIGAVVGALQ